MSFKKQLSYTLFFILIFPFVLNASNLSKMYIEGNGKRLRNAIVPQDTLDANGLQASMIRIITDMKGSLKFDSNRGIIGSKVKPGQTDIYLSKHTRQIKIFKEGFEPLEVILSDFGVVLEEGAVFELKLVTDKKKDIVIISEPSDVEKIIDGKSIGKAKSLKLPFGKHTLTLKKEGYRTKHIKIEIDDTTTLLQGEQFKLEEIEPTVLKIDSYPQGAKVFINDKEEGQTPYTSFKFPAVYKLRITKNGYVPIEKEIEIKDDQNTFFYNLIKNASYINLKVVPSDATVLIDGKDYTNKSNIEIAPGKHTISVTKNLYFPFKKEIDLKVGETLIPNPLEINLKKNASYINLKVAPYNATVLIDGKNYTNRRDIEVSPGKHTISVTKNSYLAFTKEIDLKLGETLIPNPLEINLTKNTGVINLTINPSDAKVFVNNIEQNKIDNRLELAPATYKIEVKKQGYDSASKVISLKLKDEIDLNFTLKQHLGKLQFSVNPVNANILLLKNNREIEKWQGLKYFKNLPVGEYEIVAKQEGYKTYKKKIFIEKDKLNNFTAVLIVGKDYPDITNSIGMEFVLVEQGTFKMGSNSGGSDERPIHTVNITKDFYVGKYEVTQGEWEKVMGNNPSKFKSCGAKCPVEKVSWNDVQRFIKKLNKMEGTDKYRLLTEAEWEYVSRGGNNSKGYKYSGSNSMDEVAWYTDNSGSGTHKVGLKKPNELGIYDMTGNVWEWVQDGYDGNYYSKSPTNNPLNSSGSRFVLRGGFWYGNSYNCRVANRADFSPGYSAASVGFRLAKTL